MAIVRQDTFTRANVTSGWGTATDGNIWTIQSGNGQSVSNNEGVISGSTSSTFATLGSALSTVDAEGLVRWDVGTTNTSDNLGIILRWTDSNNHWLGRWNGTSGLQVMVKASGTYTTLGSTAVTVTSGTHYWMRFRVQGTTAYIKHWQDGTSEPSSWTAQYTSSSQNVAGMAGIYGFASSTNYNIDNFSVNDLTVTVNSASTTARATFKVNMVVNPGVGIGDITRTTGTQTANKSGNGYGSGDLTGTEYDYAYKDANGSGWAVGVNPWYGGMPISAWYQIDPTLNATLPQKTSANGNLMTLLTTQSGGIVHWEEGVNGAFQASELPTFQNAGNFSELAPANTAFRAYVKCIGDAPDSNGISWTAYACIYPGDPGFVVFRLDQHNGTASAITFTEADIELIASLLGDTGANPAGIWNVTNGYVNTIGGTPVQWSNPGTAQVGTFDYTWITPDTSQSTITLGTGAVVLQPPQTQFGWEASSKYEVNDSGPNATKPTRIKFGWYSPTISYSLPAGATNTYYVLRVFSRNLTQARMDAIAADFKYPGTPTTSVGTFTAFSVDERAYTFTAGSNHLTTTLDMTPAGVTTRFKPVVKITGWNDSNAPSLTWGGSALTAGTDYRWVYDSTNQNLYLQLYFDVVTSGATSGQKNNATLVVSGLRGVVGQLRTVYQIRTGAGTVTRAAFNTRTTAPTPSRARFFTRTTTGVQARTRFYTRTSATVQARTRSLIRSFAATQTRTKSVIRSVASTTTQSMFHVRSGAATIARARFTAFNHIIVTLRSTFVIFPKIAAPMPPARAVFATKPKLAAVFTVSQPLRAVFSQEEVVASPNSTTTATASLYDTNGNPLTGISTLTVATTYADGTTGNFALNSGVTNNGNGTYTLTYVTKTAGVDTHLWTFTDTSGNTLQEKLYVTVGY